MLLIDIQNGLVHLEDGQTLPVAHWLDHDGDECGKADACMAVAGPDRDGFWLSIEVFPEEPEGTRH